ncbi:MAG: AMP-binding protein [Burkholderiales bacterium]|nr:AMP-binding protein [Burkholderiales bacterium]
MNGGAGAFSLTVGDLLRKQAGARAGAMAIQDARRSLCYRDLDSRVNRLANALCGRGVTHGDRVAMLSENRAEYIELELAAARLGAIVACLNWRLADEEMLHCIRLTTPGLLLVSRRYLPVLARIDHGVGDVVVIDDEYETLLAAASDRDPTVEVEAEDGLVILYTSGTTGFPKGALISHRAMVARAMCFSAEFGIGADSNFLAWSPLFHMAATDFSLATLMLGGKVVIHDGFEIDSMCAVLESEPISWLVAMQGMIEPLIDGLKRNRPHICGVRMVGAMADLVPLHQIAELTRLIGAPYLNSFGATETGLAPASGALLAPGVVPQSLAKRESGFCLIRLVDADDRDVPVGEPGELAIRGPTLFSGYWNAPEANALDFRGGWFHMGDLFVRHADGTLDFVDRAKYLIKSGGENIYPVEIERVLLSHEAVADAAVVRRSDARWGEVPLAFVALKPGAAVDAQALLQWCRAQLAGYKVPKEVRFVEAAEFPRRSTGKIQRHEIERQWVTA